MLSIDLSGGEVKFIGNRGDEHLVRLNNPEDQEIINGAGEYEADFVSHLESPAEDVELDLSEVADGSISFPVTIANGEYHVRRLNPRRTILTIEVEAR